VYEALSLSVKSEITRLYVVAFRQREKYSLDLLVAVFLKVTLGRILGLVLNVPSVSIKRIKKIRAIKLERKVTRHFQIVLRDPFN
jgi:broad specificity polyphosphatase/5'/3'-nucleotidase SurE